MTRPSVHRSGNLAESEADLPREMLRSAEMPSPLSFSLDNVGPPRTVRRQRHHVAAISEAESQRDAIAQQKANVQAERDELDAAKAEA